MKNSVYFHLICGFLFVVLLISGCISQIQNDTNTVIMQENKDLLLEITTEASETVYPPGKTLDFRLFSNREIEFDFYPPNTPDRIGMRFTSEKKSAKLSQEDFDKIIPLLNKSDLIGAKNYYPPSKRGLDATVKKTIRLKFVSKEKTVILEENDSHLHLKEKLDLYPASLVKLLEIVEEVNKKLRRQIDPESR